MEPRHAPLRVARVRSIRFSALERIRKHRGDFADGVKVKTDLAKVDGKLVSKALQPPFQLFIDIGDLEPAHGLVEVDEALALPVI